MKVEQKLKVTLIILIIILVSVISFAGLFVQDKNSMKNLLKDYQLGMDLKGNRVISIEVNNSEKTIYYDKDGKVVESEDKKGKTEKVPVNSKEVLTKENYLKTKQIIEKRLNDFGVTEYFVRLNEETGKMTVEIPEDDNADLAVQYIYTTGAVTIEDESGKVLLDNSNIQSVKVGYSNADVNSVRVFLNIQFNKDSIEKLKEISTTYVSSTDESGKDTSKKVNIKLDDSTLLSTSFEEEISNGLLSLSIGQASSTSADINSYIQEARNISILMNNGKFPVQYTVSQNRYMQSDITIENLLVGVAVVLGIAIIGLIFLIAKYRKNGLLTSISYIGYIAVLLIVLRYANIIITIEGMFGIAISLILNYTFNLYMLKNIKKLKGLTTKEAYNKGLLAMLFILLPTLIVGVTLCFTTWLPIYSFGTVLFWGMLLIAVYNIIVTRTLLLCSNKK